MRLTCSRPPVMATLGQLVANSLWFAFDALDQQKTGVVPKSQLKVRHLQEAGVSATPLSCPTGVGEVGWRGPARFVVHYLRDLLTLAPLVSYSLDLRGLSVPQAKCWGSSHSCTILFRLRFLVSVLKPVSGEGVEWRQNRKAC
ncbi:hypothetical protein E2C01_073971 [Portunus trituberculatus]|uniref:SWAP70 N-terminal EF-hand domain-containing protein n=1 Tax=Portunus trituberculatus TaxID=210409 RepID=A0A5B7IAX7_PORTR|nr:hypothetical protein [Portunus trituberculatus]